MRRAILAAALAVVGAATAAELDGRVVNVHDGDTLTILSARQQIRVRLADIDAPELGQGFGRASRESLAALCAGQQSAVTPTATDRYGRTVARVSCRSTDAATHQVASGMAWVFTRYAPTGSPLYSLQGAAKAERRGLWSAPQPVPPWEWRRAQKQ